MIDLKRTGGDNPGGGHIGVRMPLKTAVILGLAVASIDILVTMSLKAPAWAAIEEMLSPFAATAVLVSLGFCMLWFVVVRPWLRFVRLAAFAVFIAVSSFVGIGLALFLVAGLVHRHLFLSPFVFRSVLLLVLSCCIATLLYHWLRVQPPGSRAVQVAGKLVVALTLILTITVVFRWAGAYLSTAASGTLAAWGLALYLMATFLAVWLSLRATSITLVFLVCTWCASVIAGGLSMSHRSHYFEADQSVFSESTHPLQRVILITIDTLRRDALSCYNPHTLQTPHIDAFADDSVVFTAAYSSSPWTLPSVTSIMTGLPTLGHLVHKPRSRVAEEFPTLAERMRDAGYVTAALVENVFLGPKWNLMKGFLYYDQFPKPWPGDALGCRLLDYFFPSKYPRGGTRNLTRLAWHWIEQNRQRDFFLWIHFIDPHVPYSPPRHLLPDTPPPQWIGYSFDRSAEIRGGRVLSEQERSWLRQLYLAETQFVDQNVGSFLDALKDLNLYDDALIILTSDHGEEFWEHGGYEHGHSVYEEVITVPLMVKTPGSTSNRKVSARVSNRLITPTVLDLCQIDHQDRCYASRSLRPLWEGEASPDQGGVVFSSGALYYEEKEAFIFDDHKYVHLPASRREELYNLRADPGETTNIVRTSPEMARKGRTLLEEARVEFAKVRACYGVRNTEGPDLSPETRRGLRSLGSIQ